MPARSRNKLSTKFVAKNDLKPGRYGDGANLYLNVTPTRTKNSILILTRGSVRREVGLGSVHDVTLEKAREKSDALRRAAADGKDVLEVKRVDQSILNFKQAANEYVAAMRDSWKSPKVEKRWVQILAMKETAALNLRPVPDVNVQDVLKAVTPLWQSKPTTGKFLVGMVKRTLAWAGAHGHRDASIANPPSWDLTLKYVMPAQKGSGNFAAMPYAEVPHFVQSLRKMDTVYARALEFTILTWARKLEALNAVWSEIDLNGALWNIPAERMKGAVAHQVPLTKRALEILREQRSATGGHGLVFPIASGKSIAELDAQSSRTETPHGTWI